MEKVSIDYRPISFLSWFKKYEFEHPSNWKELNGLQLIAVACLYHGTIKERRLLQVMTGMPKKIIKQLDDFQVYKLIELMEFLQNKRPPFQQFILKQLWVGFKEFVSPGDKLKGVTFGEFIFADTYYSNYAIDSKEEDLNKFVSCFYREKKKGAKVAFNENEIEARAQLISKLPIADREAVAMNYGMMREWLERTFIHVFPKVDEESKKPKKKKQASNGSWIDVFDNVVGDDLINEDKYAQLPVMNVLRKMNKAIRENNKKKRKNGSN